MVWKTRYSVRWPTHMIQPRRMSLWVWKLGSVKATAKPCKRVSRDGMIDHTGGGSWVLGEVSTTRFHLQVYRSSPPVPFLRNLRKFSYLFGGFTDDLNASNRVDVYDPATDT